MDAADVNATENISPNKVGYLDTFYAVLFHPHHCFDALYDTLEHSAEKPSTDQSPWFLYAILSVILVSAMGPLLNYASQGGDVSFVALAVPIQAVSGVVLWLLTALLISLWAYAWTGSARIRAFLVMSAFATLPWMLMGPVVLLKNSLGLFGVAVGALLSMGVWLWSVFLFALALMKTYALRADQVIIILAMPMLMSLMWLAWVIGFIGNIAALIPAG